MQPQESVKNSSECSHNIVFDTIYLFMMIILLHNKLLIL